MSHGLTPILRVDLRGDAFGQPRRLWTAFKGGEKSCQPSVTVDAHAVLYADTVSVRSLQSPARSHSQFRGPDVNDHCTPG